MQTQSTWLLGLAAVSLLGTAQARTLKPAAGAGNLSSMGSTSTRPVAAFQHSSINSSLAGSWLVPGSWPEWDVRTQLLRFAASPGARLGRNAPLSLVMLRGYVFEDVNYGGGPGRDRGVSGATPRQWAVVELYDNAQNFLSATMTDASGRYEFPVTPDTYTVRVVNSTVTSSRPGYTSSLQAVQTYNGTTTRVGGENPSLTDAPANSGSQSLAALTSGTVTPESLVEVAMMAGVDGPDFGFNFDLVVNTNDSGQGSLRQFILNANALGNESLLAQAGFYTSAVDLPTGSVAAGLAGVGLPAGFESSIFMIPAAQLTAGVAVIAPATALPQLTGANTAVNGSTQTFNTGNTNDVLLGTGGTVGTAATPLSQLNGPEVELVGSTAVAIGLDVAGAGSQVRGLAVYGFGNGTDDDYDGNLVLSASNSMVADNAIGSTATSFVLPTGTTRASNVRVPSGAGISFTHNLIGFADGTGIYLASAVTGTAIVGNEIRGNARVDIILDGIDSHGSSTTVTNNLLADGAAQGFDSDGSAGGNVVTGNTFTSNGEGNATSAPAETAAARFFGTGNTFNQNISTGNYGSGVEVVSGTTIISQNSIYSNGTRPFANGAPALGNIGIDLLANGEDSNLGNFPFVTLNSANAAGANNLLNYPILRTATLVGSSLVLTGYAKAGATIELFAAQPNPAALNATGAKFGQGRTYLTTLTEGVNDASTSTGQSYGPGTINGFAQGKDVSANGFSFTIPLSALPGGTLAAGTVLTSTATLGGATSEFSGNVMAVAPLTGYVYEDVNYGGGAGRSFAALATPALGRAGAKVELYASSGAYFGRAITDVNGSYSFNAPVGTGYTVRVVNSSVLSGRAGATAASGSAAAGYVSNQLAVQTYNGTATHVGGANPALPDAAANTGSQTLAALKSATKVPQSVATTSVGTGPTNAGPDFGFNFDLVVNTNDAGQGSLRQFILNANVLGDEGSLTQAGSNTAGALPAGYESSIFMVPSGAAVAGQVAGLPSGLTSGVAALAPATALPAITGANTSLDGTTQTFNIGNTNDVTLGTGGTVGTSGTALAQLNGPEVQLKGINTVNGIEIADNTTTLSMSNVRVRGLSIYGFNTGIIAGVNNTGLRIEQNVIGASATSFTDPGAGSRNLNEGIDLYDSDNGFVTNNLIGFNGGTGIWVLTADAATITGNGANNNTITSNEIRGNALLTNPGNGERLVYDGLELQGSSTGNTVSGNLITANTGHGIDSFGNGIGGNTVSGNTISNNGVGVATDTGEEGSGMRVFGATNPTVISGNVLSGNNGSGVLVLGTANQVTISQNSAFDNTRLGIDLLSTSETDYASTAPGTAFWNGQTGTSSNVTRNDNDDLDTGGNGLLNFPVITTAKVQGGTLLVAGYARPGVDIELFLAGSATNSVAANQGFGQGQTYLGTLTEGSSDDTDATTGSYTGLVNGLDQGSDNTNKFAFKIPLTGRYAGAVPGTVLTSTATLGTATSEFSGTATVTSAPLPVTLVSFTAQAVQNRAALLTWTTASELRNSHFEVERSHDGVAFAKLDDVAGRGTTATATTYTFTDAQPAATGTVYYRLRQVDTDGTATYSPVRSVRFAGEALRIDLAPNPAASTVALDLTTLPAGTYQVCVLDAIGRILREQQLAAGLVHPLPLAGLPSGTYLVRVSSDALSLTKRLAKE